MFHDQLIAVVSKFTAASRGSPCDSTAFLFGTSSQNSVISGVYITMSKKYECTTTYSRGRHFVWLRERTPWQPSWNYYVKSKTQLCQSLRGNFVKQSCQNLYPSCLKGQCLRLFSRSYCYTVWSASGIILLSVCLSVRLSVTLYTAKSFTSVFLAGMFLLSIPTLLP